MEIKINYNTISFESQIECNDKDISENLQQTINDIKGKRITDWFAGIIAKVKEESNNDPFTVKVFGCDLYEVDYIKEFLTKENKVSIEFKKIIDNQEIRTKYKAIDDFLHYVENSRNDLVKNALQPNVENIKDHRSVKIEVPVIATMSSGKSTLLNALIGRNLLPSKNKATTATTCEIKINNKLKYFKGTIYDKEANRAIEEINGIDGGFIRDWNSKADKDPNIRIHIEGPVNNLDSNKFDLVLVDTPGPNNSQNIEHSRTIYTYLKDNQKLPIILFVLNAQQLEVEDEKNMLEEIKKVVEDNADSLDRILFVLNRIDENKVYDKEDPEPIEDTINQVKKYLNYFGINNPKIFPVSAEYAKLSQLELDADEDEDRIDSLNKLRKKIKPNEKRIGYQLLEHSPLTNSQKVQLSTSINKSELDADLVYSGLAALKLYIEDYIVNHHKKIQYKELHIITNNVHDEIITSIKNAKDNLSIDTEEKKKKKEENKKKEIVNIENKQKTIYEKIINMSVVSPPFNKEEMKIRKESIDVHNQIENAGQPTSKVANGLLNEIKEAISNAVISIETTLEANMKKSINDRINHLKNITTGFFEIETEDVTVNLFNAKILNKISSINVDNLNEFKRTIQVPKTKLEDKTDIFGFKSFFGIEYGKKEVIYYKDEDVVDMNEFYKNKIQPALQGLSKSIKDFKEKFNQEIKNIDDQFIEKTNKFSNDLIQEVFRKTDELLGLDEKEKTNKLNALTQLEENINNEKIYRQRTFS